MNARTAKLLRRHALKSDLNYRHLKRYWNDLPRRYRSGIRNIIKTRILP